MIEWCRQNLAPRAPGFEFVHHDVQNASFNPGPGKRESAPFPAPDDTFTLVEAISVFTHVVERHVTFYLREVARVLRPDGILHATWFLFDKRDFPMMQDFQNALYINDLDPWNAVIFDGAWLRAQATEVGLTISSVRPPHTRGFRWTLLMTPVEQGLREAEFPSDDAPAGRRPAPLLRAHAARIGLER
jgi:SAM-dependent methyltransferase